MNVDIIPLIKGFQINSIFARGQKFFARGQKIARQKKSVGKNRGKNTKFQKH